MSSRAMTSSDVAGLGSASSLTTRLGRAGAKRRRMRGRLFVPAAVLAGICWGSAPPAAASIYWGNSNPGTIGRANLDGTNPNQRFITGSHNPYAIVLDGTHLYWTNAGSPGGSTGTIARANLDGTGVDQRLVTGLDSPHGLAVAGGYIYWGTGLNLHGSIGRAKLDGSEVNQRFITGMEFPEGLAVDAKHIYWSSRAVGNVGRANLNGTDVDPDFIRIRAAVTDVKVHGDYIYWTSNSHIGRDTIDGDPAHVNLTFISDVGRSAHSLAFGYRHIYWTNWAGPDAKSTIGRANLDGSGVDPGYITTDGLSDGMAVGVPMAHASVDRLEFGRQPLDTIAAPRTLSISNIGTASLRISRVRVFDGDVDDFLISQDTCGGADLAAGASCSIHVRFAPIDRGGRSATLSVVSDDPRSPLEIRFTGTGGVPRARTSTADLAFSGQAKGTIGPARTITISSIGALPVRISRVRVSRGDVGDFLISDDTCSDELLAPGSTCQLAVRFAPGAIGRRTATLTITSDDPQSPERIALSGIGTG